MGFSKKFVELTKKNSRFWTEFFENVFLIRISFFLRLKKEESQIWSVFLICFCKRGFWEISPFLLKKKVFKPYKVPFAWNFIACEAFLVPPKNW